MGFYAGRAGIRTEENYGVSMSLSRNTLATTLNEITRQAQQARAAENEWNNPEWTRQVKNALIQLGIACEYIPYPHCGRGEFLYDVTWLKTTDGTADGRLTQVPLVAEIEWGDKGDVWYDFQKLLVARAGVRVMIFDDHEGRLLAELQDHIRHYAYGGDRYLLARYIVLGDGFEVVEACRK